MPGGLGAGFGLPEVADAMTRRGPRAQRIDFPDCGHAPALNVAPQIEAIRQFLATPDQPAAIRH